MANLTYEELKDIFTEITFMVKGLDYESKDNDVQKLVRRAYEKESQPFNNSTDDTTYVWVTFKDDPVSELFEESHKLITTMNADEEIISQVLEVTRSQCKVLEVQWIFYGDLAFDSAQTFRMKLFGDSVYNFLKSKEIYLSRQVNMPSNSFEEIANRYWMRADLEASYNVRVDVVETINVIEEVDINLSNIDQEVVIVVN